MEKIYNRMNRLCGYCDDEYIYNRRSQKMGQLKGNYIYDNKSSCVAYVDNSKICTLKGRPVGYFKSDENTVNNTILKTAGLIILLGTLYSFLNMHNRYNY